MRDNTGFVLIAALFLLVVLSFVATVTVSIAGISYSTTTLAMQSARAYFAARSGLEWGSYEVTQNPKVCPANTAFYLTQGGLQGFTVNVTCTVTSFNEGTANLNIFNFTSFATKSTFGERDYISKEMRTSVAMEY